MNPIAKRQNLMIVAWIVGLLAAGALVWFLIGRLFPDNPQGPTKNEKTADSLAITKPNDQALIDSSNARIQARKDSSARAETEARASQQRADRARRRADSLAIAKKWEEAYNARTVETVDLRKTVASNAVTIENLKKDTTELRQQLGIVTRRLDKTEAVVVGLRWDLEQARNCKILGVLNCPTRVQTAALTAVAMIAADRYRARK